MLLELIFNVLLRNVTHGHPDAHTTLPLLGLLVGAKKTRQSILGSDCEDRTYGPLKDHLKFP